MQLQDIPIYTLIFARIAVLVIFSLSIKSKFQDIQGYQSTIKNFQLIPEKMAKLSGWVLLAAELGVFVTMLLWGKLLISGFILALALIVFYTLLLSFALYQKIPTACHCFGQSDRIITSSDIWRNGGLLLIAYLGLSSSVASINNAFEVITFGEIAMLGFVAFVCVGLLINIGEIIEAVSK